MEEPVVGVHGISIHTPLAGSDVLMDWLTLRGRNFNPHSPCGERRDNLLKLVQDALFQSTLPLRGATIRVPRAPCQV